eukprot:NODE_2264_length_1247_cov_30.862270_g2062_i0.p1 GENE.NODE_2264_length_1247_cov_30.862270_g2062_i0~~NODE_2264_length_1247_cov_30.862270_g2062_i0.p1  ORF type:complete len:181 (+),score=43.57 NODE_2264_length_1247_cov_30.862270_g2062_i0:530-1072(+)
MVKTLAQERVEKDLKRRISHLDQELQAIKAENDEYRQLLKEKSDQNSSQLDKREADLVKRQNEYEYQVFTLNCKCKDLESKVKGKEAVAEQLERDLVSVRQLVDQRVEEAKALYTSKVDADQLTMKIQAEEIVALKEENRMLQHRALMQTSSLSQADSLRRQSTASSSSDLSFRSRNRVG